MDVCLSMSRGIGTDDFALQSGPLSLRKLTSKIKSKHTEQSSRSTTTVILTIQVTLRLLRMGWAIHPSVFLQRSDCIIMKKRVALRLHYTIQCIHSSIAFVSSPHTCSNTITESSSYVQSRKQQSNEYLRIRRGSCRGRIYIA